MDEKREIDQLSRYLWEWGKWLPCRLNKKKRIELSSLFVYLFICLFIYIHIYTIVYLFFIFI